MAFFLAVNRIRRDCAPGRIGPAIAAHRVWIEQGIAAGRIRQAGKWGDAGGLVLAEAPDEEQARALLGEDPLVRSGIADVELARFWPDVAL